MKDYLNYDGLAVMAHRGGSLEAPENTLESFKYACLLYTSPSPRDNR